VLLAAASVIACAQRPAIEATTRFSTALTAASSTVDTGLGEVAEHERNLRTTAAAAVYLEAAPGTTRAPPVLLPDREPTNADVAHEVLAPGFDLLAEYAKQLAYLSSGEATAPLSGATDALRASLGRGPDALGSMPALRVQPTTIAAGKQASEVILAIIEFAVEQRMTLLHG
jgi:hypothetical protein